MGRSTYEPAVEINLCKYTKISREKKNIFWLAHSEVTLPHRNTPTRVAHVINLILL